MVSGNPNLVLLMLPYLGVTYIDALRGERTEFGQVAKCRIGGKNIPQTLSVGQRGTETLRQRLGPM